MFIGFAITFALSSGMSLLFLITKSEYSAIYEPISYSVYIFQIVINVIAAILIYADMKRLSVKSNLVVIITVLFSLIGIVMFFILANRERTQTQMPPEIK
jgi:positive regulator of sigma E activity